MHDQLICVIIQQDCGAPIARLVRRFPTFVPRADVPFHLLYCHARWPCFNRAHLDEQLQVTLTILSWTLLILVHWGKCSARV